jgi:hypothetical protein
MAFCVYGISTTDAQAIRIANRLTNAGFDPSDVSVLASDRRGVRELGHKNSTKAPEGAATGVGAGAILGGAVGWLVGIGALAIPGVGPLVAAGPILAALSGIALGGAVGGLTGALVGMGIPEYEAQLYEDKLRKGNILLSVHAEAMEQAARARQIFVEEEAEDISVGNEASVGSAT